MKTRQADKSKADVYLKRAIQFKNSMEHSFEKSEWDACVSSAIHCAISAADAYCIYMKGLRSASDNHNDAIALFASIDPNDIALGNCIKHLTSLISIKSVAEYGDHSLNEDDAIAARKHAERLFEYISTKIRH